jgi:hypothetical protein
MGRWGLPGCNAKPTSPNNSSAPAGKRLRHMAITKRFRYSLATACENSTRDRPACNASGPGGMPGPVRVPRWSGRHARLLLPGEAGRPVPQATGPEAVMPPTIQPLLICWTL